MANHQSAKKRSRQTIKHNCVNRARRAAIHTGLKEACAAIASGSADAAKTSLKKATSLLAKGAAKGTLHWKTAARRTSRLAKRTKAAKKA